MSSPAFLSSHIIDELVALKGRAKVTFPYAESAHARTERILNVPRGTAATNPWKLAFGTADPEWPDAKLVTQIKLREDDKTAVVYRGYEELTGLPLVTLELYGGDGVYKETVTQRVPAGTLPAGSGGATLSDEVKQINALYAERTTTRLVDADGAELSGGFIQATVDLDNETGVPIYTDRFIAPVNYVLPSSKTGGIVTDAVYPSWKQPNTNGIGYSALDYSPPRYVVDARKIEIDGSEKIIVEVEYCRIPTASAEDISRGEEWPAIFNQNDFIYIRNDYPGRFPPPWPIGANEQDGYDFTAHRQGEYSMRKITTYTKGRSERLPVPFRVVTPGTASRIFRGLIPGNCIHPPFKYYETFADGTNQLIEDIPSSTPSKYDPYDIFTKDAEETNWRGEIYKQVVIIESETRPLSAFPDPTISGFYLAERFFQATPVAVVGTHVAGKVYGKTVAAGGGAGSETVAVAIWGRAITGGDALGASAKITASPTVDGTSGPTGPVTHGAFLAIRMVALEKPLVSDSVLIYPPSIPDEAALVFSAVPSNGDLMVVGLVGSDVRIYQFRTTLTSDAVTAATVTAGGSSYATAPTVSVSIGSGAIITATIVAGVVTALTVVAPGTGYTQSSALSISSPSATAHATISAGSITALVLDSGGANYTGSATASITHASPADVVLVPAITGDAVTSVNILDSVPRYILAPTVVFDNTGTSGTGAAAHATINSSGVITGITVDSGGSGYTSAPTATLSGANRFGQGGAGVVVVTSNSVSSIALKTQTCTVVAATNVFTASAHTLSNGDGVTFTTSSALPAPLVAGTLYFAVSVSGSTFKVATTYGGSEVDITTAGTGTQTLVYSGAYFLVPTVAISGAQAGGATGTVTVSAKNQILIASQPQYQVGYVLHALAADGLGTLVGLGTAAHVDVVGAREPSDDNQLRLLSVSPTYNAVDPATEWKLALYEPNGTTPDTDFATVIAFVSGTSLAPICTIPAGNQVAFDFADFATNQATLLDGAPDNDAKALATVPAAIVFYTDWLPIPSGKALTLVYCATGRPLKVDYQVSATATAPTTTAKTIGVTNSSTAFTFSSTDFTTGDAGKAILISGDTEENEIVSVNTGAHTGVLYRKYGGSTASQSSLLVQNAAAPLLGTGNGVLRRIGIGTPTASFLRLKLTQPMFSISDRLRLLRAVAMCALMQWTIGPDD